MGRLLGKLILTFTPIPNGQGSQNDQKFQNAIKLRRVSKNISR